MRLIDADALKEYFEKCLKVDSGKDNTKERYAYMAWLRGVHAIDDAPTVDAVPKEDYISMERTVARLQQGIADATDAVRHGKWIRKETYNEDLDKSVPWIECSECGYAPFYTGTEEQNYCSNCGAKMQGEE